MNINGFQKLTLLDYPGHVACTIFTAGCNLRCPFCHNASLVTHIEDNHLFPTDDVLEYLKKRVGLLDGVCITGGEPLLQPDIAEFISEIKNMGYKVKLDTNGTFPTKLKELVNNRLIDYVAMDIKNSKAKYSQTTGITNLDLSKIEESVDFLINDNVDFEFRTTIVNEFHTVDDIQDIVVWLKGTHKYFLQNFVDSGDLIEQGLRAVTLDKLKEMQKIASKTIENVEIRGV